MRQSRNSTSGRRDVFRAFSPPAQSTRDDALPRAPRPPLSMRVCRSLEPLNPHSSLGVILNRLGHYWATRERNQRAVSAGGRTPPPVDPDAHSPIQCAACTDGQNERPVETSALVFDKQLRTRGELPRSRFRQHKYGAFRFGLQFGLQTAFFALILAKGKPCFAGLSVKRATRLELVTFGLRSRRSTN